MDRPRGSHQCKFPRAFRANCATRQRRRVASIGTQPTHHITRCHVRRDNQTLSSQPTFRFSQCPPSSASPFAESLTTARRTSRAGVRAVQAERPPKWLDPHLYIDAYDKPNTLPIHCESVSRYSRYDTGRAMLHNSPSYISGPTSNPDSFIRAFRPDVYVVRRKREVF